MQKSCHLSCDASFANLTFHINCPSHSIYLLFILNPLFTDAHYDSDKGRIFYFVFIIKFNTVDVYLILPPLNYSAHALILSQHLWLTYQLWLTALVIIYNWKFKAWEKKIYSVWNAIRVEDRCPKENVLCIFFQVVYFGTTSYQLVVTMSHHRKVLSTLTLSIYPYLWSK